MNSLNVFLINSSSTFLCKCINVIYSLPDFNKVCTILVALPNAIGKTPVTPGSSVPEWPALSILRIFCT